MSRGLEMNIDRIVLLLLEGDALEARFVRGMLDAAESVYFSLQWSETLAGGLSCLREGGTDLVMMELTLPDSRGIDTFLAVHSRYPDLPVVIFTSLEDAALAMQAVQQGAQYQLIKGSLRRDLLVRSLCYAAERTRTLLFYLDLDDLKSINDRYGHAEGDVALVETAAILKSTFRDSDIIARVGGDVFAMILPESSEQNAGTLCRRLEEKVRKRNSQTRTPFRLSVSSGYAECAPGDISCTLDDMLRRADALMYEEKGAKRSRPVSYRRRHPCLAFMAGPIRV